MLQQNNREDVTYIEAPKVTRLEVHQKD